MKFIRQIVQSVLLIVLTALFGLNTAKAQTEVKGTVTDINQKPLQGVSIQVKGTGEGTSTNLQGYYSINAPSNGTLIFSFVGYATQDVAVKNQANINIQMQVTANALNEVVVTALGIKKEKKAVGYSVQEVKGADLVKAREPNAINSLSGKVAGLTITTSTNLFANPGIYLRGVRPLIVVDGVPINSDSWNLSPDDIESYSVLKGPTAAALYGSQGQNGAILITTKHGTTDKRGVSVEFNSSTQFQTGFLTIPKRQEEYGPGENFQYAFGDGAGGGTNDADYDIWGPRFEGQLITQWNSPIDTATGKLVPLPWLNRGHNNLQNFLQTGILSTNNIAISGNNDKGNYRLSISQLYQKGLVPNTQVGATNVNFSGTLNINKKLQVETDINYNKQYTPNYPSIAYSPSSPIYDIDIWGGSDYDIRQLRDYWQPGKVGIQQKNVEYYQYNNPYFVAYEQLHGYYKDDIFGHIKLNYNLNSHLSAFIRTNVSTYYLNQSQRYPISTDSYNGDGGYFHNGGYNESFEYFWDNNTDALVSYHNQLTNSFNLNASVGANLRTVRDNYEYAHTNGGLLVPQLWTVDNSVNPTSATTSKSLRQVKSAYANIDADYKEFLFLNLTGRIDQSSTLPSLHNAYFYPSASASLVLSQIMHLPEAISFWKLRASYARVGGDFVNTNGTAQYSLYPTYSTGTRWNNNVSQYYDNSKIYNDSIRPSFSTSYEVGTDVRFFKNRLALDVALFKTFDGPSIFNLPISGASGYNAYQINGLTTDRRGIEVTLTATPIKTNNFSWNLILNWSTYQQYLDKIYDTLTTYNHIKVGQRYDQIWLTTFQKSATGQTVYGSNGEPIYNTYPSMVGYSNNNWAASINNSFSYKDFSLSFQFDGRYGGKIVNYLDQKMWQGGTFAASANQYRLDDWNHRNDQNYSGTFVGDGVVVVSGSLQVDGNGNVISDNRKYAPNTTPVLWQSYATRYWGSSIANLHNKNFLKLREIIFTYRLPNSLLKNQNFIHSANISFVGRNMFYWGAKGVQDIDLDQWIGSSTDLETPSVKSFGVNLNLIF